MGREKLKEMTRAELQTLCSLGLLSQADVDALKPGRGKGKKPAPKRTEKYYLGVQTTCATCGQARVETFLMYEEVKGKIINRSASCPIGFPVGNSIEPDQWMHQRTKTCANCRENLSRMEKDELISIILRLAPSAYK